MNFNQLPLGFGMALSANFHALNVYAAMTEEQQQAILNRVQNAKSQAEMHQIVQSIQS